jgi:glycosyltransferase involved in cell wall biosynthesis
MRLDATIIIPTYSKPATLDALLASLEAQDMPLRRFEVIVVDDHSPDPRVRETVQRRIRMKKLHLRYLRAPRNLGTSGARNLGIAAAKGAVAAFLDDDCVAEPQWLSACLGYLRSHQGKVGTGGVTYTELSKVGPFTHQIENVLPEAHPACNVAFRRKELAAAGGCMAGLPYGGDEDAEVVWQLEERGLRMGHIPAMRVFHPVYQVGFWYLLRKQIFWRNEFIVAMAHPATYASKRGNPWREVYYAFGLRVAAREMLRYRGLILKRPWEYLSFLALLLCQRAYLLALAPLFFKRYGNWKRGGLPQRGPL